MKLSHRNPRPDGFTLKRVGTLPFTFFFGACTSINDELILACFSQPTGFTSELDKCRQASGPLEVWTDVPRSTYKHGLSSISASQGMFLCDTAPGVKTVS